MMTADEKAVRGVLERFYTAWADHDADAAAALYMDDATVMLTGVLIQGRDEVRDYLAKGFAGPLKGTRAVDEPQSIRIIDGATALIVSRAGVLAAGEQEPAAEHEVLASWALCRRDGDWMIAAYANTPAH
jgi:uncharacterized protein (TIGR02246 family)